MINLPMYRAKSNELKNTYVEGLLIGVDEELNLCTIRTKDDYIGGEICYLDTLSIHFPTMLDNQGNKIFASLQKNGKGGDLIDNFSFIKKYNIQIAIYKDNCFYLVDVDSDSYNLKEYIDKGGIRVMGIQE